MVAGGGGSRVVAVVAVAAAAAAAAAAAVVRISRRRRDAGTCAVGLVGDTYVVGWGQNQPTGHGSTQSTQSMRAYTHRGPPNQSATTSRTRRGGRILAASLLPRASRAKRQHAASERVGFLLRLCLSYWDACALPPGPPPPLALPRLLFALRRRAVCVGIDGGVMWSVKLQAGVWIRRLDGLDGFAPCFFFPSLCPMIGQQPCDPSTTTTSNSVDGRPASQSTPKRNRLQAGRRSPGRQRHLNLITASSPNLHAILSIRRRGLLPIIHTLLLIARSPLLFKAHTAPRRLPGC